MRVNWKRFLNISPSVETNPIHIKQVSKENREPIVVDMKSGQYGSFIIMPNKIVGDFYHSLLAPDGDHCANKNGDDIE